MPGSVKSSSRQEFRPIAKEGMAYCDPPRDDTAKISRNAPRVRAIPLPFFSRADREPILLSRCWTSVQLPGQPAGKERRAASIPRKIRSRFPIVELEMSRDADWQYRGIRMPWHN